MYGHHRGPSQWWENLGLQRSPVKKEFAGHHILLKIFSTNSVIRRNRNRTLRAEKVQKGCPTPGCVSIQMGCCLRNVLSFYGCLNVEVGIVKAYYPTDQKKIGIGIGMNLALTQKVV